MSWGDAGIPICLAPLDLRVKGGEEKFALNQDSMPGMMMELGHWMYS